MVMECHKWLIIGEIRNIRKVRNVRKIGISGKRGNISEIGIRGKIREY